MRVNILLVDDEPVFRKMAKAFFEKNGYNISLASNGLDAIEKIKKTDFDLIITDYRMPGLNGLNLINWIREFKSDLPVFFMTSYVNREMQHFAMEAGAKAFLLKPIDFANLVKKIEKELNQTSKIQNSTEVEQKKITESEPKILQ